MVFGFRFMLSGIENTTAYSAENNARLTHAFNDCVEELVLFHETRHGYKAGTVVKHIVNFKNRKVINVENSSPHDLIIL
jgi:hypothetical protein